MTKFNSASLVAGKVDMGEGQAAHPEAGGQVCKVVTPCLQILEKMTKFYSGSLMAGKAGQGSMAGKR